MLLNSPPFFFTAKRKKEAFSRINSAVMEEREGLEVRWNEGQCAVLPRFRASRPRLLLLLFFFLVHFCSRPLLQSASCLFAVRAFSALLFYACRKQTTKSNWQLRWTVSRRKGGGWLLFFPLFLFSLPTLARVPLPPRTSFHFSPASDSMLIWIERERQQACLSYQGAHHVLLSPWALHPLQGV